MSWGGGVLGGFEGKRKERKLKREEDEVAMDDDEEEFKKNDYLSLFFFSFVFCGPFDFGLIGLGFGSGSMKLTR